MKTVRFLSFTCLAALLTVFPAFGQQTDSTTLQGDTIGHTQTQTEEGNVQATGEKKIEERQKVAREAAEVIKEMTGGADQKIPAAILESARAVAVIPGVVKGAFIVGGRFGEGMMLARKADGSWSNTPTYVEIGGASIGFQAGVTESDIVVLFMSQEAVESILDGKLEFGGEIAAVAGPNDVDASFTVAAGEPLYTYSRSGGLFAGVSLDGAHLSIDSSANRDVYGGEVTAREVLVESTVQPQTTGIVEPFVESVQNIQAGSAARIQEPTADQAAGMTSQESREAGEAAQEAGETAAQGAGEAARGAGETVQSAGETAREAGQTAAQGAGEAARGAGETLQSAGETVREAGQTVARGTGEAAQEAGEAAHEAGETAHEAGQSAAQGTEEAAREAGETAHEAGETVQDTVSSEGARASESEDGDKGDNAQVVRDAAEVVREMTQDKNIPPSVIENAHAVAVIPNLVQGAAIVGGRFGEGVIVAKADGRSWGRTPAFIDVAGASAGLQLGVTETDLILVFMTRESMENLLDGKFELGAEASVVAGSTEASADMTGLNGPIYAYTRKEGAYAGVAVEGLVINVDDSANKEVYGSEVSARALLTGQGEQPQASAIVQPLLDALSSQAPAQAE